MKPLFFASVILSAVSFEPMGHRESSLSDEEIVVLFNLHSSLCQKENL